VDYEVLHLTGFTREHVHDPLDHVVT
jgi:hypothetical protein